MCVCVIVAVVYITLEKLGERQSYQDAQLQNSGMATSLGISSEVSQETTVMEIHTSI